MEQTQILNSLYNEARAKKTAEGGTILSHFRGKTSTIYGKTIYTYLRLTILKNLPLSYVEDGIIHSSIKFDVRVSTKTIVSVILQLTKLVEIRIRNEMRSTRGYIMYDGWSVSGVHFLGVFATYCVEINLPPRVTLLALTTMAKEDNVTNTATRFDAETDFSFFDPTFETYEICADDWCVAFISENTKTNFRISRLADKPHIVCNNHKLNLEVNNMIEHHVELSKTIETVHQTMRAARTRLRNAAVLKNLTDLRPVMHNDTRWRGKRFMSVRFNQIRTELIAAAADDDSDIPIDASNVFLTKTRK